MNNQSKQAYSWLLGGSLIKYIYIDADDAMHDYMSSAHTHTQVD
jgi:hypothetical protein